MLAGWQLSMLQMAPSGQPSILALLLPSAHRLRVEQEDRLRVELEVVVVGKRKLDGQELGVKKMRKEEASVDQTTEGLVKGLVFNFIQEAAPSLMQEHG